MPEGAQRSLTDRTYRQLSPPLSNHAHKVTSITIESVGRPVGRVVERGMIEVRARLLPVFCSVGLQTFTFWCTITAPLGPSHRGRGRRTDALVQPHNEGCGDRPRALHRRRGRRHAWGRCRLVGLPDGVREAQGRRDGRRAGPRLRGAPLQLVAPRAPTRGLAYGRLRKRAAEDLRRFL